MPGQRVGYVRVSSADQNPDRQLDGVLVERIFVDQASGKDAQRPELEALLLYVRPDDTVVVHSMDRLARNLGDLLHLVQSLTARGVAVEFLKEHLVLTGEDAPVTTCSCCQSWESWPNLSALSFESGSVRGSP